MDIFYVALGTLLLSAAVAVFVVIIEVIEEFIKKKIRRLSIWMVNCSQ